MKHKRKRSSSGGGLGGIFKLIIILLILGGLGVFLAKFAPVMLAGKFSSSERFNLVVTSPEKTAFLSLDPDSKKATIIDFPTDLYITDVAHGYGQYPLSKVYEVGELDKRGGTVLSDTVSTYLGVPVNGYIRLAGFSPQNLKASIVSPGFILNPNSNVNLWDRFLLAKEFFNLRFDRIKTIGLSKRTEPLMLADGSTVKVFLEEDLDNILGGVFAEEPILKEGMRVQIINTTETPGLGNAFARIISSIGAVVIDVTTSEQNFAGCKIEASEKMLKSKTVSRISEIMGCQTKKNDDTGRADVIVYLGQDQAKLFMD